MGPRQLRRAAAHRAWARRKACGVVRGKLLPLAVLN